jgi:hypothetical protein
MSFVNLFSLKNFFSMCVCDQTNLYGSQVIRSAPCPFMTQICRLVLFTIVVHGNTFIYQWECVSTLREHLTQLHMFTKVFKPYINELVPGYMS